MDLRRIRPDEHDAAGDVCVAAYGPFLTGAEDDYADRLHRGRIAFRHSTFHGIADARPGPGRSEPATGQAAREAGHAGRGKPLKDTAESARQDSIPDSK